MNLAFQALLLLLLLLPGFVFQAAYNGRLTKDSHVPLNFPSFTARGVVALLAACLLNALWYALSQAWQPWGYRIDLTAVVFLLMGSYGHTDYLERTITAIGQAPQLILLYFLSLYAFALGAGAALRHGVRRWQLDLRWPWLRFRNDWHYLFWGDILRFPENDAEAQEIDGTFVSATVELGGKVYLYVGILVDYWFDRAGNLDRILLQAAWRRELDDDRVEDAPRRPFWEDERYYPIEGDFILIPAAGIKTINVEYIMLVPEEGPATPAESGTAFNKALSEGY